MQYIITDKDEKAYIRYDKHHSLAATLNRQAAHLYCFKTAKKVLLSDDLKKLQYDGWKIIQSNGKKLKETLEVQLKSEIDTEYIPCDEEIVQSIKDIVADINGLKDSLEELAKRQSESERELVDEYHAIEFGTFSGSGGYKELMKLKGILQKRRAVKNTQEMIRITMNSTFNGAINGRLASSINGLANRKYKKRINSGAEMGSTDV